MVKKNKVEVNLSKDEIDEPEEEITMSEGKKQRSSKGKMTVEDQSLDKGRSEGDSEECSLEKLACELSESRTLALDYLNHLQRLTAEFDNYKKRMDKERTEIIEYANVNLVAELIDVMENMERGIASARESQDRDSILKGMEMVYNQLKSILESKGLEPIDAVGQKFDHQCHDAMMKETSDECPDNTVLEEFQRGYRIKGRVVRYSKVKISEKKEK
ncbi:MAG: nucleotide exchange factor GrpE [Methanosarcinales archaeon]|nr:nucleotide exchange factor GrpE [ANME-2 cluster archaeon]MDW7775405.1 nucleotide exchange factor GrpE [Methanosarcinales archaeon]